VNRADALVIVAPEYNHGYPGLLKHVLDTNLKEYIHKAAGIVGVSAGIFGGARAIQNLIPVLRELGLVTIFWGRELRDRREPVRRGRQPPRQVVVAAHRNLPGRAPVDGRDASPRP
jgi:hypothetical protein